MNQKEWQQKYLDLDMKFQLHTDIKQPEQLFELPSSIFLIGSCFTENIGQKLQAAKFSICENPHGILFNPASIVQAFQDYFEEKAYCLEDLFQLNEVWHSWNHHSRFSDVDPELAIQKINTSIAYSAQFLKTAKQVVITLGSAWVYQLVDSSLGSAGSIVANNHKAPANLFRKRLLLLEEVIAMLDNVLHRLFQCNNHCQVVFTVSPVRHLREGLVDNNRSKSVLLQAVHHLADKFNRVYYFPAYEIVVDELRDYRFFAEDLVHPNYQATQYVWDKLKLNCMSESTNQLIAEIDEIKLAFQHRSFHPTTEQHQNFIRKYLDKTILLQTKFPMLDFENEIAYFKSALLE